MRQQRALWADEVADRIQTHGKEAELMINLLTRRGTEYHIRAKSDRTQKLFSLPLIRTKKLI